MVQGVKETFIKRLQNLDWMDAATKIKAENKVPKMVFQKLHKRLVTNNAG